MHCQKSKILIKNQTLRIVAGAVKTTPIDSMPNRLNGDKLLRTIIQEKNLILWEKRLLKYLDVFFTLKCEVNQDLTRNLRIHKRFL
ncbi:hypothetical protein TNIN_222771 [Trichonephila inaurata madagascariensis]|uniref:Uncharacterized protein n=1 Tax=Trichonephila inaurata madagascariensis TaxID=2747483 RepID=A0A8X6XSR8_9ARAC|nr:hypothetical protein TNIN_222771 [Trichonephila inaurata madagascariensis]